MVKRSGDHCSVLEPLLPISRDNSLHPLALKAPSDEFAFSVHWATIARMNLTRSVVDSIVEVQDRDYRRRIGGSLYLQEYLPPVELK
jgi:hypothetical protein